MSVAYDWSPAFGALNNLIQQQVQKKQYEQALSGMFGQGQMADNPVAVTPAANAQGADQARAMAQAQNAQPFMTGGGPLAGQADRMLPMFQAMNPQIGMPLLLNTLQNQQKFDMERQEKQMTPMSAAEVRALGYRPGTVAFKDPFGGVHVSQQSDLKSPEAIQQDYDVAKNTPMTQAQMASNKIAQANLAVNQGELNEKRREFNASNPMLAQGGVAGPAPISSYPQATQAMVKAMIEGRQAPPTSFALSKPYWQNMIALANSIDPSFDQTMWSARVAARKDATGGGKTSQLFNSGNTAIQHLGRLYDQIPDVAGHQFPLVGNLINSGENAVSQASGVPGVNAYNDTAGHLSEELTKFYRGTGGSEKDIERNMSNLGADLSTPAKQAGVANTVHLIYGAFQPKVEQYNKTMGTNFPVSHFLSQKSVETIKRMGYDPDTGEKLATPGEGGWSIKLVK